MLKLFVDKKDAYINGLVQERRNSSALAMELRLSSTNPSIWLFSKSLRIILTWISLLPIWYSWRRLCILVIWNHHCGNPRIHKLQSNLNQMRFFNELIGKWYLQIYVHNFSDLWNSIMSLMCSSAMVIFTPWAKIMASRFKCSPGKSHAICSLFSAYYIFMIQWIERICMSM